MLLHQLGVGKSLVAVWMLRTGLLQSRQLAHWDGLADA